MQEHASANPGIHLEKTGGLDFFDVDGFALIQNCKVHGHSNLLAKSAHERKRDAGDVEIGLRVSAKAEDFETQAIAARFRLAAQVTALFEGSKDVARGAFGDAQFAA